jgi:hypothetical protein
MNFNTNKRLLTYDEKMRRAIFDYTFNHYDFNLIYEDENNLSDDYGQPLIKIKENFDRLDDETKALVLEFANREIYDETIDLKCLNCDYEELNQDYEEIEEMWDGIDYPKLYCPKCGKGKFVPLDIWKQKNKYKR